MMTEIRICSCSKTYNYRQRWPPLPTLLRQLWSVDCGLDHDLWLLFNIRLLAGSTIIHFTYFMLL